MGGGKSASKAASREATQARNDEQARQERIRQGTSQIGAIFDGGVTTGGRVDTGAAFDPNMTYYRADGSAWTPPAAVASPAAAAATPRQYDPRARAPADRGTGGRNLSPAEMSAMPGAAPDPWASAVGEGLYTSRTQSEGAFGDAFFDGQRQRFVDYAMPQLEDQKREADKKLLFAMDRSGNTESSARAGLSGELEKRAGLQRQQVLDEGQNFANTTRTNVENARNDLVSMLNVTGDAQGAANSAMARAAALSRPTGFSPIGNLFADLTGGLATQAAAERAGAFGGPKPRYDTGLFGPRTSAVQVT